MNYLYCLYFCKNGKHTVVSGTAGENDDYTIVRGGFHRVVIEIIISLNDENDGQPLKTITKNNIPHNYIMYVIHIQNLTNSDKFGIFGRWQYFLQNLLKWPKMPKKTPEVHISNKFNKPKCNEMGVIKIPKQSKGRLQ